MKRLQKPSFTVHWFRLWKKFCHRGLGRTCCFCAILSINVYSTTLLFSPNEQFKKSQIRRKPGQQSDGRLIRECLAELSPALLQRCCGSCWTFSKAPATPCSPTMWSTCWWSLSPSSAGTTPTGMCGTSMPLLRACFGLICPQRKRLCWFSEVFLFFQESPNWSRRC